MTESFSARSIEQSRPDSGRGFQVKGLLTFCAVPSSPESIQVSGINSGPSLVSQAEINQVARLAAQAARSLTLEKPDLRSLALTPKP